MAKSPKFKSIILEENGILLDLKRDQQTAISFSELNKIYIKKRKFSIMNKIGIFSILLFLTAIVSNYFPIEIVFLIVILYIPFTVKLNTHIRYQLHVLLYDGTFFIKNFNKDSKQDHINLVHLVRKEVFYYQVNFNFREQTLATYETKSKANTKSSLRIPSLPQESYRLAYS